MTDEIRHLTARLAADPGSLAFLALGEALRRRGQLDAALTVAQQGLARYPDLADAHDLLGRIRSDAGEGDLAFDAWTAALRFTPTHLGAHKGLAYLAFRAGDTARALRHLELAAQQAPADTALTATVERARARLLGAEPPEGPHAPPLDPDIPGTMLVDGKGRRLAGVILHPDGSDVSDAVAAQLAGVSREAARAARLLELGVWESVTADGPDARLHLAAPTPESILLAVDDPSSPSGRLPLIASRAAQTARRWLESLR